MASLYTVNYCSLVANTSLIILILYFVTLSTSYPASSSSTPELNSLCQKSATSRYLFHNETEKCYKEKSRGPCPTNMKFYAAEPEKRFGKCDCIPNATVPWAYDAKQNDCFKTYQQAYCSEKEWLVFEEVGDYGLAVVCRKNPCLGKLTQDEEFPIVSFKMECVKLQSTTKACAEGEIVSFGSDGSVFPTCVGDADSFSIYNPKRLSCKSGTLRDSTGRCRSIVAAMSTVEDDFFVQS